MDDILVIGGGGHAKSVLHILKHLSGYNILGYVDVENKGILLGVGYLGNDDMLPKIKEGSPHCIAVLGIGYLKISNQRELLMKKLTDLGYDMPAVISLFARVGEEVVAGKGTVIMDGVVIGPGSIIGEGVILNTSCSIDHDCHIENYVHIAPGVTICGGVTVGSGSFIGAGSTIIQYKRIGPHCMVRAGTVVVDDYLKSAVYVGAPARRSE